MNNEALTNLECILYNDEDEKLTPYKDSLGNWTYGVGRFIGKELSSLKISKRIALEMLKEDIEEAQRIAIKIFGSDKYYSWIEARRDAILCLIFNMGEGNSKRGFLSFKNTIQAIKEENWNKAAENMLDSLWATQVDPKRRIGKGRDDRLAFMLKYGDYHPEYRKLF